MEKMVSVLDKNHLRPLQKESYRCMADCCDSAGTAADLQHWYAALFFCNAALHYAAWVLTHSSWMCVVCRRLVGNTYTCVCVCVLLCSCQNCERKVQIAEKTVQISMNDFQERLQRCIQRCQDSAQESLPVNPSDKDVAKAQDKLANCAAACAQEYEKQIPKLQASIIDKLKHAGH